MTRSLARLPEPARDAALLIARLLKLIDDLLDLVRFDTGHTDINTQATAMDAHLGRRRRQQHRKRRQTGQCPMPRRAAPRRAAR